MKKLFYSTMMIALTAFMSSCGDEKAKTPELDPSNPFFTEYNTPYNIPPFDKIKNEHFLPALNEGMKRQNDEIEKIVKNTEEPNFENTIVAFSFSNIFLNEVQNVMDNFLSSNTNDSLQKIATDVAPAISQHTDNILMNSDLFAKIDKVFNKRDQLKLSSEQSMLLDFIYKKFVRGGAKLDESKKTELKKINEELSVLGLKFGDNILAETNKYQMVIDNKEKLAGLPESLIEAAAMTAKEKGMEGKWVFTLQNPSIIPFLQYSAVPELRAEIQKAYVNRGNNNDELDNKEIIKKLISLKLKKANLLGYSSHAAYVLEINMAEKPEKVFNLLNQIWTAALPNAIKERETYQKMMKSEGIKTPFTAADWRYYTEKVRKEKYSLDEEMMKPYFKLENVRQGIFDVAQKLFGLTFKPLANAPKYHPDAEAFEVQNEKGEVMAVLYLDYYPRASKRGGAWMTEFRSQYKKDNQRVSPIITVNCNFTRPTETAPSLLTWDEVSTFFHEFGHALHGMLSDCNYYTISGTSVARDFVELPSQIMENWAGEPEVLKTYAKHYKTGEVIPDELIQKMEATQHFNQGFATVEYLAAALLDMNWHTLTTDTVKDVLLFEKQILDKISLIPEIVSRYRSTYFQHIFSGGYDAGYYSYLWAEVLDADAFAAFKEKGIFDKATADSFKNNILSKGYTAPAMTLYKNFRGREPEIAPLLKRKGLN